MSCRDEFEVDFIEAVHFLQNLRAQIEEVDPRLSKAVSLVTNHEKGVMYIRGTSGKEKYMWVLWDYLCKIPDIIMEFKIPVFGLECIEFKFLHNDKNHIQSKEILSQCLTNRLKKKNKPLH